MGVLDETLRLRREELRLDQETLAAQVGVSQQTISRWETGAGTPRPPQLKPLARALDLDVDMLHRLAGYLPPGESSPAAELFTQVYARVRELSDTELLLLMDRAWQEHRIRLGLQIPGER